MAPGMKLDVVTTELEERMDGEDSILPARKMPERTTRLQRGMPQRYEFVHMESCSDFDLQQWALAAKACWESGCAG
jgi:hypothetical protein